MLHGAHETVEIVDAERDGRVPDHAERIDAPHRLPEAQAGTADRGRRHRDAAVGDRQARRTGHLPRPIGPGALDGDHVGPHRGHPPRPVHGLEPVVVDTDVAARRHHREPAGPRVERPLEGERDTRPSVPRRRRHASRSAPLAAPEASRLGDEERVAHVDQVAEVAGQHQTLGGAAEHPERRLELDAIRQLRAVRDRFEAVLVAERPERPPALLVDEAARAIPLGDRAGHRPRDAEVARPPRHELTQPDHACRHPADGLLTGTFERTEMGVDRQGQVERGLRVDGHERLGIEANHRRPIPTGRRHHAWRG